MTDSLPPAFPLVNLQVDYVGRIASKGRSGDISRLQTMENEEPILDCGYSFFHVITQYLYIFKVEVCLHKLN